MDEDHIDMPALDLANQSFKSWTIEIAACESPVVKLLLDGSPPFMALALNISQAGVSLGIE
jgi:hypothetical protein